MKKFIKPENIQSYREIFTSLGIETI